MFTSHNGKSFQILNYLTYNRCTVLLTHNIEEISYLWFFTNYLAAWNNDCSGFQARLKANFILYLLVNYQKKPSPTSIQGTLVLVPRVSPEKSFHCKVETIPHAVKKKLTSDGSFDSLLQVRSYRKIAPKFVPSTIASNETSKQVYSMVKDLKLSWALSFRALNKFFTPCPLVRSQTWSIKFLVPYCALYGRQLRTSFSGSNSERTMSLPMTKSRGKQHIALLNLAVMGNTKS